MRVAPGRSEGFTLIELMVTLAVIVIITLIALPSFRTFQQRSALRAAADQAQSFWNQARFEAAKRNQNVVVSVSVNGASYCLGARADTANAITSGTDPDSITDASDLACDCLAETDCDVAVWPKDQGAWREVSLNGTPSLGTVEVAAVIEPKRTSLLLPAQAGNISFKAPSGPDDYRLNLRIDQLGRAMLCESTDTVDHLSDYVNQSCAP